MEPSSYPVASVLLVEDEPSIRSLVTSALRASGYYVIEAQNGVQAIDILDQMPIDLVILDMKLPYVGGQEVIAHVRQRQPDLRILCMSGYPKSDLSADVPFMSKPFSKTKLLQNVRGVLSGGAALG